MKINSREKSYKGNSIAFDLINYLQINEAELNLKEANLYYDFPIFKDIDGDIVISQILLISIEHGIVLITLSEVKGKSDLVNNAEELASKIDQLHSIVFSRLLRNKALRKSKTELLFPIKSVLFTPHVSQKDVLEDDTTLLSNYKDVQSFLDEITIDEFDESVYLELIATIEGAKGIIKPKERDSLEKGKKKGIAVSEIEKEINAFDQYQKMAFINEIIGPERIRGLAGSGKTVVLALKAAIAHLRNPEATIVYTFYTKSLYQHIQRLITRFYRQYDDKDPDWNKLRIIHAWGSVTNTGIYYEACENNSSRYYTFSEASSRSPKGEFDFVCRTLLESGDIKPLYDYIFIDEGQDFPKSFLTLCVKLVKDGRIVWAYDELQTIFQAKTPDIADVLENTAYKGLEEDIILYKCYRNPREILLTAHAVGFGIYSRRIVQMLEDKDYWNDIGYRVIEGDFKEGSKIKIERPLENSLETVSKQFDKNEIVKFSAHESYSHELKEIVKNIKDDFKQGLLADDILVVTVDDRNAKGYLSDIQTMLAKEGIRTNNIHADKFSVKDFQIPNHITLSTIHKAKGNEAYSVHIVGIDYLYSLTPTIRERNLMFTAMTRAKGWVTVTGIGNPAGFWMKEIETALDKCPFLEFTYPSSKELRIMKRDIKEKAIRKSKQAKILDELLNEMSPEEIKQFLEQREVKKRKEN